MAAAVCAATAAAEAITMTTTTTPPDNESMSPLWVFMASQDSSNSKAGQKRLYAGTDDITATATIYYSADPLAAIRQFSDTTPSAQAQQAQRGRQQQQPVVLGSNALTVKPRSTRHTHRLDEALENNNKAQTALSLPTTMTTTTTVYTACGEKVLLPQTQTTWHIHMVIGPLHKHTSAQAVALLWNTCQPNVTSKLEWGADIARHFELQCYCSASLAPPKEKEEEEEE
jgi:hypothetical protein